MTARRDYQKHRAEMASAAKQASQEAREIGPLPKCGNPKRRAKCKTDFRVFCETYLAATFHLGWSADHLVALTKTQTSVLDGGLFALAMPRGSGKTSMIEAAAIWAMLYGHRKFLAIVGADETAALMVLDSIKTELESNDLLAADFPEACIPIRKLEGIPHRCNGQLLDGKRTHIGWQDKLLNLATVEGAACSGALIKTAGITGRIRGMKHKLTDGRTVRPDFVMVDDPQSDESARSPSQCQSRESVIGGAILGLSGPGKKISGIMLCTVIYPGDLADRALNKDAHPEWQGERFQLVYQWPAATKLWDQYAELRRESLRKGNQGKEATEFYRAHKDEMDMGAKVAWEHRKNPDELSAIQHAMNLRIDRGEAVMASEYQNEPLKPSQSTAEPIDTTRVIENRNGLKERELPAATEHLVAFIDVQQQVLFYTVVAWSKQFTGAVVDYGAYPDQKISYFNLHSLRHTLAATYKGKSIDAALFDGLSACINHINREYRREDGTIMRLERAGIDSGYKADIVYQLARSHASAGILTPTKGISVRAGENPMAEWKRSKGEAVGDNWRYRGVTANKAIRHLLFDTNYWKSFLRTRLNTSIADPGALTLYSGNSHRMLLDHLASETPTETYGRGRRVEEWRLRAGGMDNHWLDGLVGCCMLGSVVGCKLQVSSIPAKPVQTNQRRRERVRYL
jgi:hypothetical protein